MFQNLNTNIIAALPYKFDDNHFYWLTNTNNDAGENHINLAKQKN